MQIDNRSAGREEGIILTGMVMNKTVCSSIAARWPPKGDEGLFGSRYANTVAYWCKQFYERHGDAPGRHIAGIYQAWASKPGADKDTAAMLERFLGNLSAEYEHAGEVNPSHVMDIAGAHFNFVRVRRMRDSLDGDLDLGDLEAAQKRLETWSKIEMGQTQLINVLQDESAWTRAFEQANTEPLIVYPGQLGKFFGRALRRDRFISFMAPEKRGKTFWLAELAWEAMLQRRRTMFFSVGDMAEGEILAERFGPRAAGRPAYPCRYNVPLEMEIPMSNGTRAAYATVKTKECLAETGLTAQHAHEACHLIMDKYIKSDEPYLKLGCAPNDTMTVLGLEEIIEGEIRRGWVPDVVVIDYADILAASNGHADTRDQINTTWKGLRRMSQKYHCLVVTATQADAAGAYAERLTRNNFSEDKRKFSHIDGMIALNQTEGEKALGIMRLNWLALRGERYVESHCVHVAGCYDIGRPAMKSIS